MIGEAFSRASTHLFVSARAFVIVTHSVIEVEAIPLSEETIIRVLSSIASHAARPENRATPWMPGPTRQGAPRPRSAARPGRQRCRAAGPPSRRRTGGDRLDYVSLPLKAGRSPERLASTRR